MYARWAALALLPWLRLWPSSSHATPLPVLEKRVGPLTGAGGASTGGFGLTYPRPNSPSRPQVPSPVKPASGSAGGLPGAGSPLYSGLGAGGPPGFPSGLNSGKPFGPPSMISGVEPADPLNVGRLSTLAPPPRAPGPAPGAGPSKAGAPPPGSGNPLAVPGSDRRAPNRQDNIVAIFSSSEMPYRRPGPDIGGAGKPPDAQPKESSKPPSEAHENRAGSPPDNSYKPLAHNSGGKGIETQGGIFGSTRRKGVNRPLDNIPNNKPEDSDSRTTPPQPPKNAKDDKVTYVDPNDLDLPASEGSSTA
ncbi:hypothetical protein CDD83_9535 [Cordyceps sp. RAO-2017]|nr:hypothetical protein CDD83_9535 [Cordyceps sp. RAO-2017]